MLEENLNNQENETKNNNKRDNVINWMKQKIIIKEISSEEKYGFDFKNSTWLLTIIYLSSFIAVPIFYSLIKTYAFHISSVNMPQKWQQLDVIFTILIPFIGIMTAIIVDWKTMFKKGAWAAYSHFVFGFISSIIFSLMFITSGVIKNNDQDPMFLAVSFLVQIIIQFAGTILVLFSYKPLRIQIKSTLKEAKSDLLFWVLIFFIIGTVLTVIFNAINNSLQTTIFNTNSNSSSSENQKTLELMTKTPLGIFAFVLGTVFLAPINEEISYRFGTFAITRNKWLGFSASLIYFPSMHILQAGDWNDILGYLSMAVVLPALFVNSRGNSTYTIGLHMLWNLVAASSFFIFGS